MAAASTQWSRRSGDHALEHQPGDSLVILASDLYCPQAELARYRHHALHDDISRIVNGAIVDVAHDVQLISIHSTSPYNCASKRPYSMLRAIAVSRQQCQDPDTLDVVAGAPTVYDVSIASLMPDASPRVGRQSRPSVGHLSGEAGDRGAN